MESNIISCSYPAVPQHGCATLPPRRENPRRVDVGWKMPYGHHGLPLGSPAAGEPELGRAREPGALDPVRAMTRGESRRFAISDLVAPVSYARRVHRYSPRARGVQAAVTAETLVEDFLADRDPRRWSLPKGSPSGIVPEALFLGEGDPALEVALATSRHRPKADDVRSLWKLRQGRRPSPLLLVVAYEDHDGVRVTVCGPVGDNPPLVADLEPSQVERLAGAALAEPSRHAAERLLVAMLPVLAAHLIAREGGEQAAGEGERLIHEAVSGAPRSCVAGVVHGVSILRTITAGEDRRGTPLLSYDLFMDRHHLSSPSRTFASLRFS